MGGAAAHEEHQRHVPATALEPRASHGRVEEPRLEPSATVSEVDRRVPEQDDDAALLLAHLGVHRLGRLDEEARAAVTERREPRPGEDQPTAAALLSTDDTSVRRGGLRFSGLDAGVDAQRARLEDGSHPFAFEGVFGEILLRLCRSHPTEQERDQ
jgi:hypothetical protein